jgi:hypothetical protein
LTEDVRNGRSAGEWLAAGTTTGTVAPPAKLAGNVAAVGREGNGAVVIGDRTIEDQARVVEGCGDGSSDCRIEIDVSAGTAVCDESGGDGNIVRGRGRANAGQGGSCSRDASGGTVEIGDVNP